MKMKRFMCIFFGASLLLVPEQGWGSKKADAERRVITDVNAKTAADANYNLGIAAQKGDLSGVKNALSAHADVNAMVDLYGRTALMYAAERRGNLDMVKALVEAGADVNAKRGGETVLSHAAFNPDIQLYLKQHGAK
jgi:ankyrin repeat protein